MEEKALQVEHWRGEFKKQKVRLGRNWRSCLFNSDKGFNNDEGRRAIETVSDGRASLIRTVRVVNALRKVKVEKSQSILSES